ncbi:MAG: DUF6515 family protein [Burkholderiales bacterium]
MEKILSRSVSGFAALAVFAALFASFADAAEGQGAKRGQKPEQKREQKREPRRETFRTPHWGFDDRFHHNHYYPQRGYTVRALPPGRVVVRFRNEPFFFHSGVWYRQTGPSFIVVRPPLGIVVPILPPAYSTVVVAGVPYYYANEVYYVQQPDGYAVTAPPEGMVEQADPAAPPPQGAAPGAEPQSSVGTWYYCDSAKAYYPYVAECKEGWRTVPAAPPQAR